MFALLDQHYQQQSEQKIVFEMIECLSNRKRKTSSQQ